MHHPDPISGKTAYDLAIRASQPKIAKLLEKPETPERGKESKQEVKR